MGSTDETSFINLSGALNLTSSVVGAGGADSIVVGGTAGQATIAGAGNDSLSFTGITSSSVVGNAGSDTIHFGANILSTTIVGGASASSSLVSVVSSMWLVKVEQIDFAGSVGGGSITGGAGNDIILQVPVWSAPAPLTVEPVTTH